MDALFDGFKLSWEIPRAYQEFFLPVWGPVRLNSMELQLIDHPAFARLADIYQLGQTHLVFRGATHKRWEHALGTLHAASMMCDAIERNFAESEEKGEPPLSGDYLRAKPLSDVEVAFVRLSALLHDIGHISAGHTFEDELGLLTPHDADDRLNHVLDRRVWRGHHELATLRELIDSVYASAAANTGLQESASEIFLNIVSKSRATHDVASDGLRTQVCRDIVGNTICADILDYLHRDFHHLGKPRPVDGRILEYFEIRQRGADPSTAQLVVNLRGGDKVRHDAVTAIFELLEARYQLGEIALFHRTKLIASAMLERIVAEVSDAASVDAGWFEGQLDTLLDCSDEELPGVLTSRASELITELSRTKRQSISTDYIASSRDRIAVASDLGRRLRLRKLHKQVRAFKTSNLPSSKREEIERRLGGAAGKGNRLAMCRRLEHDFRLEPGSVVLYCPARTPHAKIAMVQVVVGGQIGRLSELDSREGDPAHTGGLFVAQGRRFAGLWCAQVSISPEARDKLKQSELLDVFGWTVEELVFGVNVDGPERAIDVAYNIATVLKNNEDYSQGASLELVPRGQVHGRASTYVEYVTGAPSLRYLVGLEP
ncbi:HD domain-containing protein [Microbacterium sp. DT81.1]|uniref:HD domain-containing protein n=1 Tax=Microbacterium sp. DT81.1 TaxID=3393413 RepID=UPI003CF04957